MLDYFPDTSLNDLEVIVERYKSNLAWKKNIVINEEEWNHLQEIIRASLEDTEYVEYDTLVYSRYFKDYE